MVNIGIKAISVYWLDQNMRWMGIDKIYYSHSGF